MNNHQEELNSNTNEKRPNLISRAINRLRYSLGNSKVLKRIASLVIIPAMSLTMLSACSACNTQTDKPVDPGTSTNPGGDNPGTNPGGDNPGTNPGGDKPEPPKPEYSNIVKNILNDSEINTLINRAKNNPDLLQTAYFDPHPYSFLANEGHNVQAIKDGTLECHTISYTTDSEPNSLYILTYVENPDKLSGKYSSFSYYTEYGIKYNLTEKEMNDYTELHKNNYIQAVFLNDEISNTKEAQVFIEFNMEKESHKSVKKYLSEKSKLIDEKVLNSYAIDFIPYNYDKENGYLDIYAYAKAGLHNSISKSRNKTIDFQLELDNHKLLNEKALLLEGQLKNNLSINELSSKTTTLNMYLVQEYRFLKDHLLEDMNN